MKNDLCIACGGKGFHWKQGLILSHTTKLPIADTYQHGPTCDVCHGTGKRPNWLGQMLGCFGVALLIGVAILGLMAVAR